MNPSDFHVLGNAGIRCLVTGAVHRDKEAAIAHTSAAIAEANRVAGRTLFRTELIKGVGREDPRSEYQRIADRQADYLADNPTQLAVDDNPYRRALALGIGAEQKRETMTEKLTREAAEFDQRKAAEQQERERQADPRRQKAVAHATDQFQAAKFDATVTTREYELLERRLDLARTGDLAEYKVQAAEWSKVQATRINDRAAVVDGQIAALRKRKQAILSGSFEPEEPEVRPTVERHPYFQRVID